MKAEEYTRLWEDGWAVTKAIILRMRDAVKAQGGRFAMMVMAPKLKSWGIFKRRLLRPILI